MTVNTTKITSGPYVGNNIADQFSYTFKVDDKTQLSVYETTDLGVETLLTVDTHYTVAGISNDSGGIITRVAGALPTDYEWFIRSNYEETQLTAFSSQGAFFPDLHENAMDKMTFLIQQLLDERERSPSVSKSYTGLLPLTLEDPVAGEMLRWNSDLTGLENVNLVSGSLIASGELVIYPTVAAMKADTSGVLVVGINAKTQGYYTPGDGGGGSYLITASQAVDGFGDHELDDTNVALLQKPHSIVNVLQCGAIADNGVTVNTATFAAAVATGLSVFVPKPASGNYYKADIVLNDDQTIYSWGAYIQPVVVGLTHGLRSTCSGLNFIGYGKTVGSNIVGISALGKLETQTRYVRMQDIKGDCYQRNECVDRHQGNHLTDFIFKDSVTGINEGTRSEYNKTANGSIFGCDDALRVKGGNNIYSNVSCTDNINGLHLVGGANDAHGSATGLSLNHNVNNVLADNITVPAFDIVGCQMYAGDIHLLNSNGVTFVGGSISIAEIKEENARYCSFSSVHFVSAITVSPNYNGTFSEVYYHDSNTYSDTSMTRPTFFPEGSRSTATLENSLLALADGSTTNVLDTLSSNAISGNPLFAWQAMFQTPANVFDGTKKTRVDGSLIHFTGEINVTRPTSYIPDADVKVQLFSSVRGIVATATLARQSDNGSTLYTNVYRLDAMIARENDTYELRVVNNSGGDVNVYRDQTGDLVCNCSAWGW